MKPDPATSSPPTRLPAHITTKKMLWAVAVLYGIWLAWMGYVAWVNVQAGNQ